VSGCCDSNCLAQSAAWVHAEQLCVEWPFSHAIQRALYSTLQRNVLTGTSAVRYKLPDVKQKRLERSRRSFKEGDH
jgi:hypothetical protein